MQVRTEKSVGQPETVAGASRTAEQDINNVYNLWSVKNIEWI